MVPRQDFLQEFFGTWVPVSTTRILFGAGLDWACRSLSILGPNTELPGNGCAGGKGSRLSCVMGSEWRSLLCTQSGRGDGHSVCNSQFPPCHPGPSPLVLIYSTGHIRAMVTVNSKSTRSAQLLLHGWPYEGCSCYYCDDRCPLADPREIGFIKPRSPKYPC